MPSPNLPYYPVFVLISINNTTLTRFLCFLHKQYKNVNVLSQGFRSNPSTSSVKKQIVNSSLVTYIMVVWNQWNKG